MCIKIRSRTGERRCRPKRSPKFLPAYRTDGIQKLAQHVLLFAPRMLSDKYNRSRVKEAEGNAVKKLDRGGSGDRRAVEKVTDF